MTETPPPIGSACRSTTAAGREGVVTDLPPTLESGDRSAAPEIEFGLCALCFEPLERPFWDTYCFECQRGDDEAGDALDEAIYEQTGRHPADG